MINILTIYSDGLHDVRFVTKGILTQNRAKKGKRAIRARLA